MPPEISQAQYVSLLNLYGDVQKSTQQNDEIVRNAVGGQYMMPSYDIRHSWMLDWATDKTVNWEDKLREITEFYSRHIVDGKVNGYHSAFGMIWTLYRSRWRQKWIIFTPNTSNKESVNNGYPIS